MTTKQPSEQLVEMLGQPYDPKTIQALLKPYGVRRLPAPKSYFNDDIIWTAKSSLRMDLYRGPKLEALTGLQHPDPQEWIIGSVQFLAPGADDRIKTPYPGLLPGSLTLSSSPVEAMAAYGQPAMDEECEWPGFSGRILAWRGQGINIVLEYEDSRSGRVLKSCTACLIGCIGAWTSDNPEVFAP
ncbi:hypothetical protein MHH28_09675 [Paenibacillus sp. FSL K6-1217]|uniref:hypothetical protein n=1 Tax=Paenibacillus sp. FSL K6-1217 TaxID=2921466 RepID=UPI00324546D7